MKSTESLLHFDMIQQHFAKHTTVVIYSGRRISCQPFSCLAILEDQDLVKQNGSKPDANII